MTPENAERAALALRAFAARYAAFLEQELRTLQETMPDAAFSMPFVTVTELPREVFAACFGDASVSLVPSVDPAQCYLSATLRRSPSVFANSARFPAQMPDWKAAAGLTP